MKFIWTPRFWDESETISSCMAACPIHQDIRGCLALLKDGDIKGALEKLLQSNPLPASVSRVCQKFCGKGCSHIRGDFDGPLAINTIERFLGDWALENYIKKIPPILSEKRIAIVGSGPAGLSCAYLLKQRGHYVTVFEREKEIGGLLRWGAPEDRLPKNILAAEIALHLKGVDFCPGAEINESNFDDLKKEFQAIFLAPGLGGSRKLEIPGENFPEVIPALTFLKGIQLSQKTYPFDRPLGEVVIIGGGNTAMDCARVAKMAEAKKVKILHRRQAFRAHKEEEKAAKDLQIESGFALQAQEILRLGLSRPRLAIRIRNLNTGEISISPADLVVVAIGQKKETSWVNLLQINALGGLEEKGIFLGGDLAWSQKSVAFAIGSANQAVEKIVAFLERKPYKRQMRRRIKRENIKFWLQTPKERLKNLSNPDLREIIDEARRCFSCGLCRRCENCLNFCPSLAITKNDDSQHPFSLNRNRCQKCATCLKVCSAGAIYFSER